MNTYSPIDILTSSQVSLSYKSQLVIQYEIRHQSTIKSQIVLQVNLNQSIIYYHHILKNLQLYDDKDRSYSKSSQSQSVDDFTKWRLQSQNMENMGSIHISNCNQSLKIDANLENQQKQQIFVLSTQLHQFQDQINYQNEQLQQFSNDLQIKDQTIQELQNQLSYNDYAERILLLYSEIERLHKIQDIIDGEYQQEINYLKQQLQANQQEILQYQQRLNSIDEIYKYEILQYQEKLNNINDAHQITIQQKQKQLESDFLIKKIDLENQIEQLKKNNEYITFKASIKCQENEEEKNKLLEQLTILSNEMDKFNLNDHSKNQLLEEQKQALDDYQQKNLYLESLIKQQEQQYQQIDQNKNQQIFQENQNLIAQNQQIKSDYQELKLQFDQNNENYKNIIKNLTQLENLKKYEEEKNKELIKKMMELENKFGQKIKEQKEIQEKYTQDVEDLQLELENIQMEKEMEVQTWKEKFCIQNRKYYQLQEEIMMLQAELDACKSQKNQKITKINYKTHDFVILKQNNVIL